MLLPVLPLMNVTLFPGMIGPLSLGRPKSQAAVAASLGQGRELAIFTQHFESAAEPGPDDLFPIGVRAHVMEVEPVNERQLRVKVQSLDRVRWRTLQTVDGYLRGECEPLPFDNQTGPETEALMQDVRERTDRLMGLQQKGRFDWDALEKVDWPIRFYLVAANLDLSTEKAQELLAQDSLAAALRYLAEWLQHELLVAEMRQRLHKEAAQGLKEQEKTQLLRQELANIHRELGDDVQTDLDALRDRLEAGSLPEEPRHEAERQLTSSSA